MKTPPNVSCPKCGSRIRFNAIENEQDENVIWMPFKVDCMGHEDDIRRALTEASARDPRIRYSPSA